MHAVIQIDDYQRGMQLHLDEVEARVCDKKGANSKVQ
jgi:hypothetical protein